jgi:hypothetical protein
MRKRNSGDLKFLTPQEKTELFKVISTDMSRLANRNKVIFFYLNTVHSVHQR